MKCDESRPECLNCIKVERSCQYHTASTSPTLAIAPNIRQKLAQDTPFIHCRAASVPEVEVGLETVETERLATNDVTSSERCQQWGINMLHLELFHHTSNLTCPNIARGYPESRINTALSNPFLMHELLAVSTLHLSTVRLAHNKYYINEAVKLEIVALSLFNTLPHGWNSANPIPVFLFSSFLGIHILFHTLLFRPGDFSTFIDHFVEHIRLRRSVPPGLQVSWSYLMGAQVSSMLPFRNVETLEDSAKKECELLKSLLQSANLDRSVIDTCLLEIEHLQTVFDSFNVAEKSPDDNGEDMIFLWPTTLSLDFTELLLQKIPEALAILAYYAVLLHRKRNLWVIKDGGIFLIEAVMRHLGSGWEEWLAYPISVILDLKQQQ